MYENGKRVNSYQKKKLHKRKLKNKFAKATWFEKVRYEYLDIYYKNKYGYSPEYWKSFYLSGCRQLAKNVTNDTLRQNCKNICHKAKYYNDYIGYLPQNNDYRKYCNYNDFLW